MYLLCSDEPTKPGTPEIVDYDNKGVNLKWEKCESDGGAPIEKYIIEKKDRNKPDWEKAVEVPGNQLEARVDDLKERGEYQFRVVAVNKAGPSPASDPSKMQIIRHKARKFTLSSLYIRKYKYIACRRVPISKRHLSLIIVPFFQYVPDGDDSNDLPGHLNHMHENSVFFVLITPHLPIFIYTYVHILVLIFFRVDDLVN